MLWLKHFDRISHAYPKRFSRRRRAPSTQQPIILRPGGLGDMVLLTRAAALVGIDLSQVLWFGERRNLLWTDYLRLPSLAYDRPAVFIRGIGSSPCSSLVINSEQTFGLSSVFASRLVSTGGTLVGFDSNTRADLYDRKAQYDQHKHELDCFTALFESAGLSGSNRGKLWPLPERGRIGPFEGAAVVAFAGVENPVKALSVDAWRSIIESAKKRYSSVVTVGAPADRAFSERVLKGTHTENLVGKLSFPEVVDLLRGAVKVISVDSGLIHVADYCGVPSEVIFLGGNPKKWRPLLPESRVIETSTEMLQLSLL